MHNIILLILLKSAFESMIFCQVFDVLVYSLPGCCQTISVVVASISWVFNEDVLRVEVPDAHEECSQRPEWVDDFEEEG